MKKFLLSLVSMILFSTILLGQDICGFWKSVNEKTGQPQCVVAIYEYHGKYYGRMIGTFDDTGKMTDTIYTPKGHAQGVVGEPFFCGMDFIYNLRDNGSRYKGKIIDPDKGNVYDAELWVKDGNLIVRGELFIFGRNQTWPPAVDSDFPKGFKKPDVTKFVPVIPEVK